MDDPIAEEYAAHKDRMARANARLRKVVLPGLGLDARSEQGRIVWDFDGETFAVILVPQKPPMFKNRADKDAYLEMMRTR